VLATTSNLYRFTNGFSTAYAYNVLGTKLVFMPNFSMSDLISTFLETYPYFSIRSPHESAVTSKTTSLSIDVRPTLGELVVFTICGSLDTRDPEFIDVDALEYDFALLLQDL
jgi:hypothetical protein